MADPISSELQHAATSGAVAADQQEVEPKPVPVAPSTADQFNTLGARMIPKGCFRMEEIRFAFDSSFPGPDVKGDMPDLADLIERHSLKVEGPPAKTIPPPLCIFGHADPVGQDEYNKPLSGRRALAVYAMLVRDVDIWEDLYTKSQGGDQWGTAQVQIMLAALGHDPGPVDGVSGDKTKAATKEFQQANGLSVDGVAGPNTRKALYRAYMDDLCGPRLELDPKEHFLARAEDGKGLKGDVQGCGEFNPILMFSKEEHDDFERSSDKTERNLENGPNRRVMILLFAPGRQINPEHWPCPRAREGVVGCKKRFFVDADQRRQCQQERREFEQTQDTFACRFYQLITDDSPCEKVLSTILIRLFDSQARSLPFAPCVVTEPGKEPRAMRASGAPPQETSDSASDDEERQDAFITLRCVSVPSTVNIKWSRPKEGDGPGTPLPNTDDEFEFELDVLIEIPEDEDQAALSRLKNLGYVQGPEQEDDIRAFQRDYKPRFNEIEIDGTLNAATKDAIESVHESCDLVVKNQS